ncbi:hypothetical protein [Antarctobacter heliothermus]|uniref:Uncharacterized protein n=1 Tax=Antarctobacter heliothermus TaxID=74033 RepID=A0A239K5J1_9RHOB|nr:hypothetical protein [Antarctobacter heliothermus]SNT12414.1 hypothetical protein SAMN04488078_106025 [Antarctobacter heliothermus]
MPTSIAPPLDPTGVQLFSDPAQGNEMRIGYRLAVQKLAHSALCVEPAVGRRGKGPLYIVAALAPRNSALDSPPED